MIDQHRGEKIRVFAVWEPILPTDWTAPSTGVLSRLSDDRVHQIWDKQHVLAKTLSDESPPSQPKPDCCNRRGILWDLIAVYPAGVSWDQTIPAAVVFNGPVVRVMASS